MMEVKNKFYEIPEWVKDLDDLSEYLDLRGDEFNCLKQYMVLQNQDREQVSSTGIKRDSNKLLHYAQRVQARIHNDERLGNDTEKRQA